MTREDDRERADAFSGPCCDGTRAMVIASTLWDAQDAVDQASKQALSCTDKNQLADVLSQLLLARESCIKWCNLRERRSVEIQTCCQQ